MTNLAWIVAATAAIPNVWIVDDDAGPGTHFSDIPAAIAAASDGDTIIVEPGVYTGFTLLGKSLVVLGPGGGAAMVFGQTVVGAATPTSDASHIAGLTFIGDGLAPAATAGAGGFVTFVGCEFLAGPGMDAFRVNAASAFMDECFFFGGPSPNAAGAGVRVDFGGALSIGGSTVLGGDGLSSVFGVGSGGAALAVDYGFATVRRTSLFGGGVPITSGSAGIAGDGLRIAGLGFARATGDANDVIAGGAAYGSGVPFVATTPGAGIRAVAPGAAAIVRGSVAVLGGEGVVAGAGPAVVGAGVQFGPGATPKLDLTGDTSATGTMSFVVDGGPPAAPYLLAVALNPGLAPEAAPFLGDIVVGHPAVVFHVGFLDAFGTDALTGAFGVAYPSIIGVPLHVQGLIVDGANWTLTNSVAHVLR